MITKIPHGYAEIVKMFGDPSTPGYEKHNIVRWEIPFTIFYDKHPVTSIRIHRLAVANFEEAFRLIKDSHLELEIEEYNGTYNYRPIRGRNNLSTHAFGIAIDLGASDYPLGSDKRFPDSVVNCFTKAGFIYGGDFSNRKDPMHFQLASGY